MAGCVLGCSTDYRISISGRCRGTGPERKTGGTLVNDLPWERISFGRRMDDTSEAQVIVPRGCCDLLRDIRPWAHEMQIWRDGEEAWSGPVVLPVNCTSRTVIVARDQTEWLKHRVIHDRHCWSEVCDPPLLLPPQDPYGCITIDLDETCNTGQQCIWTTNCSHVSDPIGSVQAAEILICDGLSVDDPCLLDQVTTYGTGVVQGRDYLKYSGYVFDALKDLAKGSLDFTAIGRRIILMEEGHELGRTGLLTCDEFSGDVCTTEDGLVAGTAAYVVGQSVGFGPGQIVGFAGGTDPFYGRLEILETDDRITRQATAAAQAANIVAGHNPPPVLVQPPDSGSLSPTAPVCFNELVPGVVMPVITDCTCRDVAQLMRLQQLDVTVDGDGERIVPLLTPVGYTDTTTSVA